MLFIDTSALYAFLNPDDAHHTDALRVESRVRANGEQLWTIDSVLSELWTLLRRDLTLDYCDRLVAGLLAGGVWREPVQAEDYARAWEIGRAWPDQDFSLTDRQAFAAIERSRHLRAWSYDRDFAIIRLGPTRNQAIDVIR